MKSRIPFVAVLSVVAALISAPAYLLGQQASQVQQRDRHHAETAAPPAQTAGNQQPDMMNMMASIKANDQKLDELVVKMNAAKGTEKTDAIAELLTVLVQDRRMTHDAMRAHMSAMMNMMGNMHERGDATTTPKQ